MKRIGVLLLTFLLLLSLPVGAAVMDGAQVLDKTTADTLSESLTELGREYGIDIAVYTESRMRYETAEETGEYYYDLYCGEDGILLYLAENDREYWFVTDGRGKEIFNSRGIARLKDAVEPHLREDAFYEAFIAFADEAETMLAMAAEGTPYNKADSKTVVYTVLAVVLLPLLAAFIMTLAKTRQMKTARENHYASNYIKDGSFHLDVSRDIFLYSTLVKTPKPKASSGSGRSHGGGGGRF